MVAARAPVDWLPLVAFAPLQPPDAVQLLALVEDQASVADAPLEMLLGVAVNESVGGGVGHGHRRALLNRAAGAGCRRG